MSRKNVSFSRAILVKLESRLYSDRLESKTVQPRWERVSSKVKHTWTIQPRDDTLRNGAERDENVTTKTWAQMVISFICSSQKLEITQMSIG